MFSYPRKTKYPTSTQIDLWTLKRNRMNGEEIAKKRAVTPGMVSKTLTEANKRVKGLLLNAARMNKITIEVLSEEQGYARGLSHMLGGNAYITYSPENGVQVWYDHKGDCIQCDRYSFCRQSILQEFKERNIPVQNPSLQPTFLVEKLIEVVEERLK